MGKAKELYLKQYVQQLQTRYKVTSKPVSGKKFVAPAEAAEVPGKTPPKDYGSLTKNQLVKILWDRGIDHNKRQNKFELIELLEAADQ